MVTCGRRGESGMDGAVEQEGTAGPSKQPAEIFRRKLTVAEDLRQQTRTKRLTRVHRHHRSLSIRMTKVEMTAFDSDGREAGLRQSGQDLLAGDTGEPRHLAI